MLLRGGRCTRFFRLIINVLYTKRGKSAPPSIKTLAKKCTCNPDTVKKSICHAFTIAPLYRPFREGREMGLTTDLQRTYNGPVTDLKRRWNGPITIGLDIQPVRLQPINFSAGYIAKMWSRWSRSKWSFSFSECVICSLYINI